MNTAVTKTFPLSWNIKNSREADTILSVLMIIKDSKSATFLHCIQPK